MSGMSQLCTVEAGLEFVFAWSAYSPSGMSVHVVSSMFSPGNITDMYFGVRNVGEVKDEGWVLFKSTRTFVFFKVTEVKIWHVWTLKEEDSKRRYFENGKGSLGRKWKLAKSWYFRCCLCCLHRNFYVAWTSNKSDEIFSGRKEILWWKSGSSAMLLTWENASDFGGIYKVLRLIIRLITRLSNMSKCSKQRKYDECVSFVDALLP